MKNPRGKIYLRRSNPNESVFCLESNVEGQTIHVYFKGTEIGNGTYVLRKMSAKGISMYAQLPKAKKFAMEILQKLLREAPVYQVSDSPGWIKTGEDDFIFVGEDSITWEYLVEVVK